MVVARYKLPLQSLPERNLQAQHNTSTHNAFKKLPQQKNTPACNIFLPCTVKRSEIKI